MSKKIFVILCSIFLFACVSNVVKPKKYFTLEYNDFFEKPELSNKEAFDFSVLIQDAQIPSTYNRRQIVVRNSSNTITYSTENLWGIKLSDKIAELLAIRLTRYNTFKYVERNISTTSPDYQITINVRNIELISYGGEESAHLNLEIELFNLEKNTISVKHNYNKQIFLLIDDKELFIQSINNMMFEAFDEFIKEINDFIAKGEYVGNEYQKVDAFSKESESLQFDFERKELENDLLNKGQIVLPNKTSSDQEPFISVFKDNEQIEETKMGETITLAPGHYIIKFGSGSYNQLIEKKVEVIGRYKKVIKPDWGWLTVNLIDQDRNSISAQYEIFDLDTGESFGTGRGVQEELGEQLETWVLKSGKYKIVLSGEPFNTKQNYITVELQEGKLENINIVIEEETGSLLGGGSVSSLEYNNTTKLWKLSSSIHGNVNLINDNSTDKNNSSTTLSINTQFDNRAIFDKEPYHISLKFLLEGELTKLNRRDLTISNDAIDFKSTLIYYVLKDFGIYTRADVSSHFYNKYIETINSKNYALISDSDIDFHEKTKKIKIQPCFAPTQLKEGIGLNYRALNTSKYKINIRSGFGLTQDFNNNAFKFIKNDSLNFNNQHYDDVAFYEEMESVYSQGIEVSLVSLLDLPFNISLSTDADVLFPFDKSKSTNYKLENKLTMKLLRHISLEYNFDVDYNKDIKDYIVYTNKIYLRFTYFIY